MFFFSIPTELLTKNSSWQAKQSILHVSVTFYGDCMEICEDFDPNFGDKKWLLHHDNALFQLPFHQDVFDPRQHDCCPQQILLFCFLDGR
jgi:hypothetical protein